MYHPSIFLFHSFLFENDDSGSTPQLEFFYVSLGLDWHNLKIRLNKLSFISRSLDNLCKSNDYN